MNGLKLFQECPKQLRSLDHDEHVKFLSDGQLYINEGTHIEIYAKGFCLENFYHPKSGELYMSAFLCRTENSSLSLPLPQTSRLNVTSGCNFDRDLEVLHRWLRFVFTFCGFFSLTFLFLSLFFYMTLPELCNFQGNIICAYITSTILTTGFLILLFSVRLHSELGVVETEFEFFFVVSQLTCQALGYLLYCSGLLMFSWMSVLCFDLLRY